MHRICPYDKSCCTDGENAMYWCGRLECIVLPENWWVSRVPESVSPPRSNNNWIGAYMGPF